MPYSYTKKTWTNYSGTPINATNLTDHEEWFDTNTNPPTLKVYSGGSWVAVSAGESLKAADRITCNAADGWATSAGWFPTARYLDADKATTYYRDPGNEFNFATPAGKVLIDLCLNNVPLSVDMKSPRCGEWP
jgi:hypothetical protein